jgi:hypothetical protein
MMRTSFGAAIAVAACCAAGLGAQGQETKTTTNTKVELKGGKDVTVIGCLERSGSGDFVLTDIVDSKHDDRRLDHSGYALIGDADFAKHVGERVEIKGKAAEDGKGKVSIESKEKTEVANAPDRETVSKTEATGGSLGMPFLGVKSVKKIASSCK